MAGASNNLLFSAAVLLWAGGRAIMSRTQCPDCGSTPVPYPLSTGPGCGDQSYKIRCDAGKLMFDTVNNTYAITSISPENQRLVIQPAGLVPNTCLSSDLVYQGIQLNSSLPFNVTSSNTIVYLNCTDDLLKSPLNCSETSLCRVYINGTKGAASCKDAGVCCSFRTGGSTTSYSIRAREAARSAYSSFVNLDPSSPVERWPAPGLELEWALPLQSS